MSLLPSQSSLTVKAQKFRTKAEPYTQGGPIIIDSSMADAGNTPTTRLRAGVVVAKRTSTGRFVLASDSNADHCAPASVSSATGITSSWANTTFTFAVNGGPTFTVTMATATNTNAAVVALLNADAVFKANLISDVNATAVRIRTLRGGSDQFLSVTSSYASAFGASVATATSVGTDPDVRVIENGLGVDLVDINGTAAHGLCDRNSRAGCYSLAALVAIVPTAGALNLTAEAQAVLKRNGSIFEA